MKVVLGVFILIIVICKQCQSIEESLIDYYENLIKTEIAESAHYKLPTNSNIHRPENNSTIKKFGVYDFIVVGSGPGGSVIANRLSEVKKWNILLIEAGGPESNFSVIPGMNTYLLASRFNWGYKSVPQTKACLGSKDKCCGLPRGKGLGGGTSINYLIYSRGHKTDFDRWADEGNPGWSYADVLPYFIKSENSEINGDPEYHGHGGYWNVKYHRPHSTQISAFLEGSNTIHYSGSSDYNGKEELGFFHTQLNTIKQYRQSASKAFLEPIAKRPNLKIITGSFVTKILTNRLKKSAVGVIFTKNGMTYSAKTKKEVILSAGSINSPQILMLSGIGPKQHLEELNIPVIRNLPVGKTLYDHPLFLGAYITTNSSVPNVTLREQIEQFLNDFGPLTIPINCEGVGFYQSKFGKRLNYPAFEIEINTSVNTDILFNSGILDKEIQDALYDNMDFQTTFNAYIFVLQSDSIGKITLRSNDPFQYPEIDANLLDKDNDIEIMYEGIQTIEQILQTEPMRKINASLVYADYPQCRDYKMGSKKYWLCALRLLSTSGAHQIGTCRMGSSLTNSVVDNRGRVHGLSRLRVVDASIIPFPLAGHPTAAVVMLGEKISDYIKLDHGIIP